MDIKDLVTSAKLLDKVAKEVAINVNGVDLYNSSIGSTYFQHSTEIGIINIYAPDQTLVYADRYQELCEAAKDYESMKEALSKVRDENESMKNEYEQLKEIESSFDEMDERCKELECENKQLKAELEKICKHYKIPAKK